MWWTAILRSHVFLAAGGKCLRTAASVSQLARLICSRCSQPLLSFGGAYECCRRVEPRHWTFGAKLALALLAEIIQ